MDGFEPNFYAQWLAGSEGLSALRERATPGLHERLLQGVWNHQRLTRDKLRALDGTPVRVLHPGFWNREAGPDFRGAVVQFGGEPPQSGDIEIDLSPGCWRSHNHDKNPAYQNVILHVVWAPGNEAGAAGIPSLALERFLDSPLEELKSWFGSEAAQGWPEELKGECCAPLARLTASDAQELLLQAGALRFQAKARAIEARARQCGWEQALWEGLFRGLGYKQNVWPMQRLAELLPELRAKGDSVHALQAKLLGTANLMPESLALDAPQSYSRRLWDHWWRERGRLSEAILPKTLWRFNGLRPANQPQRRLALAAHWLASDSLVARLEDWFVAEKPEGALVDSLLACLQPPQDEFWSAHWSFHSPPLAKPQPLLGESRLTDLAVNVVLPWFWMRASAGQNERLRRAAERRFCDWPLGQDNSVLRLARQRLFGQAGAPWIKSAAAQQGLLQVVRDCCNYSNAVCAQCPFPDLARAWEAHSRSATVSGTPIAPVER